ncbi:TIGR03089 family protein [Lentzea sp. DG1S-22]|uniref:TIGR03089 family protein n=1 Tax=unclassified Lentzea TaxID=2643253 RepID=UPI0027DFDC05|nr:MULTISPECIES: TIGR03089 family protein [unclassified Lentzea]MCG8925123.1 TIGR03089 family protein [Lentzea sp. CC55]WVH79713.1 TIGR03089 family protein [Lentzea sp. DG1S-22]
MSVTEILFTPLLKADPGRPLITHFDDAAGTRMELSRATTANWAAKTANWLRDEHDVEPGDPVAVLLPAHWQTAGLLLGAWWCGAHVVGAGEEAKVAVVPPGGTADADVVAVASLDVWGRGSGAPVDYMDDVRVHGDDFTPWQPTPGTTPALCGSTVEEVVAEARDLGAKLGADQRVLSTVEWNVPAGVVEGFLAVLAAGGSLVQVSNPDAGLVAARRESEKVTLQLG